MKILYNNYLYIANTSLEAKQTKVINYRFFLPYFLLKRRRAPPVFLTHPQVFSSIAEITQSGNVLYQVMCIMYRSESYSSCILLGHLGNKINIVFTAMSKFKRVI